MSSLAASSQLFALSLPPPSLELLLAWFKNNDIHLDERLEVRTGLVDGEDQGWSVWATEDIDDEEMLCRMPKTSTFNHISSSLSRHLTSYPSPLLAPPLIPPTHILTLHLLYELILFSHDTDLSRWSGYLQSLPRTPPPLAMLWPDFCDEDGRKAWDIVRGGEVERRIKKDEQGLGGWAYEEGDEDGDDGGKAEWGAGGIPALRKFYTDIALPVLHATPLLSSSATSDLPSFETFLHAYTLVSSRAFHVDDYLIVGLVPLADLFNHSPTNNICFTIDEFVCTTCGSLIPCSHDKPARRGAGGLLQLPERLSHLHELEERDLKEFFGESDSGDMVSCELIVKGEQVFNSYGSMPSVELVCEYGFIPEDAMSLPQDRIHFDPPPPSPPPASHPAQAATSNSSAPALPPRPQTSTSIKACPPPASTPPSIFSHPLLEILSDATQSSLRPSDRHYVSPDAQLSAPLALAVGLAVFGEGEEARVWDTLADEDRESVEWGMLRDGVVEMLEERLVRLKGREKMFEVLEDQDIGQLQKMAATLVLGERATLEACRSRWVDEEDEDEAIDG